MYRKSSLPDLDGTLANIHAFRLKLNPKPVELKPFIIRKQIYWMNDKAERNSLEKFYSNAHTCLLFPLVFSPEETSKEGLHALAFPGCGMTN